MNPTPRENASPPNQNDTQDPPPSSHTGSAESSGHTTPGEVDQGSHSVQSGTRVVEDIQTNADTQQRATQNEQTNPLSTTPSSSEHISDTTIRSGLGGFAALVDSFMNGFRTAVARQQAINADLARDGHSSNDESREQHDPSDRDVGHIETHATEGTAPSGETSSTTEETSPSSNNRPRTLFFRMPLPTQAGQSAILAFNPGPIPVPPPSRDGTESPQERPTTETQVPESRPENGNGQASGFHLPNAPIFVPLGASPLPFSFLFDTQTNTAWPIAAIPHGPPGSMPPDTLPPNTPQFVAGPPFHIALNINFGPPPQPEQPDPERASRFVASLERADAELRDRMARLGMGDIGGGSGEDSLGCGICLDEYATEDRPEWIGGQASIDEEVVGVPCAGHHTLHHRCLYEWLAKVPPSQWSCPFCRAPLDQNKVDQSAVPENSSITPSYHSPPTREEDSIKKAEKEARSRTLREEVRVRERGRGWRCDSPACLPRYPCPHQSATSETVELVTLLPCRHKLHFDCLCTSMRLEQAEAAIETDEDDDYDDQSYNGDAAEEMYTSSMDSFGEREAKDTVGKWVTCPTCRHEAWAELPACRRSKRVEASKARIAAQGGSTQSSQLNSPTPLHPSITGSGAINKSQEENEAVTKAGVKRAPDLPLAGAREQARQRDLQSFVDSDSESVTAQSDVDVEAMLL